MNTSRPIVCVNLKLTGCLFPVACAQLAGDLTDCQRVMHYGPPTEATRGGVPSGYLPGLRDTAWPGFWRGRCRWATPVGWERIKMTLLSWAVVAGVVPPLIGILILTLCYGLVAVVVVGCDAIWTRRGRARA